MKNLIRILLMVIVLSFIKVQALENCSKYGISLWGEIITKKSVGNKIESDVLYQKLPHEWSIHGSSFRQLFISFKNKSFMGVDSYIVAKSGKRKEKIFWHNKKEGPGYLLSNIFFLDLFRQEDVVPGKELKFEVYFNNKKRCEHIVKFLGGGV